MVLLNHLIRMLKHSLKGKKAIPPELDMDEKRRLELWKEHLKGYTRREELSRQFNYANAEKTSQDFGKLDQLLDEIESLIDEDFINIKDEEKNEEEILSDIGELNDIHANRALAEYLAYELKKSRAIAEIFKELHKLLKAELHLIKLIRKKMKDGSEISKEMLLNLFILIFQSESPFCKVFDRNMHSDNGKHKVISQIAQQFLLEKEIKDRIETAEEKFARLCVKENLDDEPKNAYQKLAEDIVYELLEEVGTPIEDVDRWDEEMKRFIGLARDDKVLYGIIKKLRPKYSEDKIKAAIGGFRIAIEDGSFEDLIHHNFAT